MYSSTPEVLRKDMDQAYIKGLRDAKALFDDGILTQEELMREKELLLRKRDEREARASSRPTLHLPLSPSQAPSDTGIGGRMEKEAIREEPRQILMLAPREEPRICLLKTDEEKETVCPGLVASSRFKKNTTPASPSAWPPAPPAQTSVRLARRKMPK